MRLPLFSIVLLVIFLSACERPPERVAPRFAWPEEGTVRVNETVTKQGLKGVVSYELMWKPDGEGTGFIVSNRGFRFESINGVSAAIPRLAEELEKLAGLKSVYPDMHIDQEGNLIEFRNWDAIMAQALEIAREGGAIPEEGWDQFERIINGPAFRALMERKTRTYWDAWVGAWVGFEMNTGETETFDITEELAKGIELTGAVTISCDKVLNWRGKKCFSASAETEWDSAAMKEFLPHFADTLLAGLDVDLSSDAIESCRRYDRVWGVYEIDTLRPRDVKTYTSIEVVVQGDPDAAPEKESRVDEHRYRFDWPDLEN